jgi:hypothetical protein
MTSIALATRRNLLQKTTICHNWSKLQLFFHLSVILCLLALDFICVLVYYLLRDCAHKIS